MQSVCFAYNCLLCGVIFSSYITKSYMLFSRYLYSSHGLVAEVVYYQPADLDLIPTETCISHWWRQKCCSRNCSESHYRQTCLNHWSMTLKSIFSDFHERK